FTDENRQEAATRFKASLEGRPVDREESAALLHQLAQGQYFHGVEFLSSYFYESPALPIDHFNTPLNIWRLDPFELARANDHLIAESKTEFEASGSILIRPQFAEVYSAWEQLTFPTDSSTLNMSKVRLEQNADDPTGVLPISTSDVREL